MNDVPPFRFSRESTIRIDREGYFWHDGARVQHQGLARALARWVDIDHDSNRYVLRNAMDWCFITVDDAPLVVRSATVATDGHVTLLLSDDTTEPLVIDSLRVDADDVPYCDVRGGTLPARFTRAAAFSLFEHLDGDGDVLRLGGRVYPVRRVGRGEGAPHRAPARPESPTDAVNR